MASQFPSTPEQIIPTASNVGPEPHHPFSSQASLHTSYLGLHDIANAMNLSIPPNALRVLAQGHASGRLPMPLNLHAGLPAGAVESVAPGIPTTMGSYSQPAMFRSSPETTLDQPSRDMVRAPRAPRKGKSQARTIVSRGPTYTAVTSYRGDRTQSTPLWNEITSASQVASPRGEATPPITFASSSDVAKSAVQPFLWATATSKEIVLQLPVLNNLPHTLIDAVLPGLRAFIEEHERSVGYNSPAAGHGQKLPAETPERSEPTSTMVEPSCGLDQPPETLAMCGRGFNAPSQQRNGSENAEPQLIVEEPPSTALQGLLDIDQIWGMDVCQSRSECSFTLPAGEVIERSPWTGSDVLNPSSGVGCDVDLGGVGMEAFGQVDLGALLDSWEGFADM